MKCKLRTQKENTHQYCKNCHETIRVCFLPQSQLLCFRSDLEMREGLLVKALDVQIKTPALVFTDDEYSKGKSAATVVKGLNTNLKTLGNH